MACTCVFTCALHQIYDNDFFSIIMRKVSIKFNENIDKNLENHDENESFLILKNISLIYSFFYLFDSISLDFLNGYISFLLERMNNEIIELLLTIIQNIGMKVRKDNPKILKDIIDSIKDAFERYKTANDLKIIQRGDFLLMILNDIKLNKNLKNNSFESMGFLISWIKKNVLGKLKLVPKMFTLLFAELKNADFNQNRWWIFRENNANLQDFQKVYYNYNL